MAAPSRHPVFAVENEQRFVFSATSKLRGMLHDGQASAGGFARVGVRDAQVRNSAPRLLPSRIFILPLVDADTFLTQTKKSTKKMINRLTSIIQYRQKMIKRYAPTALKYNTKLLKCQNIVPTTILHTLSIHFVSNSRSTEDISQE